MKWIYTKRSSKTQTVDVDHLSIYQLESTLHERRKQRGLPRNNITPVGTTSAHWKMDENPFPWDAISIKKRS